MNRDLMSLWRVVDSKFQIPDVLLQAAHPTVREQWQEGLISSVEMMEHIVTVIEGSAEGITVRM